MNFHGALRRLDPVGRMVRLSGMTVNTFNPFALSLPKGNHRSWFDRLTTNGVVLWRARAVHATVCSEVEL